MQRARFGKRERHRVAWRLQHLRDEPRWLLEEFVKNRIQSFSFLATLAIAIGMVCWGSTLNAQNAPSATPDQQTPSTQQPTPNMPPDQQPATKPAPGTPEPPAAQGSQSSATSASSGAQEFSGTVMKTGDKYVLKDDSGKTFDIDHQTDVAKFEGKRVKVQGTLDETGKKILVK